MTLIAILVSSLLGSVHCVAMCGPLIGLAGTRTVRLALVHSLGRLATYAALGAAAGLVGSAIDLAGKLGNVQRAATIVAGGVIVGWGLVALGRASGLGLRASGRPATKSSFGDALVHIRSRDEVRRAAAIGALTGLLPCGWLWAFVVVAAGTGGAGRGALAMAAFWLGTVPAMIGVLGLFGPAIDRVRRRVPALTAAVLILLGAGTLALRWRDAGATQVASPHCHCHEAR